MSDQHEPGYLHEGHPQALLSAHRSTSTRPTSWTPKAPCLVAVFADVDVLVLTTSCIDVPGFDAVKDAPRCLLRLQWLR
jgi:hypothetical protein